MSSHHGESQKARGCSEELTQALRALSSSSPQFGKGAYPSHSNNNTTLCYCGYVKDSEIGTLHWIVRGALQAITQILSGVQRETTHTREDTKKMMWLKRQNLDWCGHKARVPSIIREGTGKNSVSPGVCRDSSAWTRFFVRFILDSGLPAEEQLMAV